MHAIAGFMIGALGAIAAPADDELEKRIREIEARLPKEAALPFDVSLGGLFAVGGSTADADELLALQGGGHDPRQEGFTVQNVELSLRGTIDDALVAAAHIVYLLDPDGESVFELEEAYLETTSLPGGLQAKAGTYFTEFGRLNPTHPHAWEFVDQPFVMTRMFGGDGMRGPGARVAWEAPHPLHLQAIAGVQNAGGETMPSFLGAPGEPQVGGHPRVKEDAGSPADLAWSGRLAASLHLSPTTEIQPGASGVFGPNGTGGRTRILGGDLTLKWKPLEAKEGIPFVSWTTEYFGRRFAADAATDPDSGTLVPGDVLHDAGLFSQVTWGFARGWSAGIRWEQGDGSGGDPGSDPYRGRRTRATAALTWHPSGSSRIRLQANRDEAEFLDRPATSVWLQFEFLLGAHGAADGHDH